MVTADARAPLTNFASEQVLDLLNEGVCVCDQEGFFRYCNRRAVELCGRAPRCGDHLERFGSSIRMLAPDGTHLTDLCAPMAEVLRTGQPQRNRDALVERPDGSRIRVVANIEPLGDGNGALLGVVNVFQEVVEQRAILAESPRNGDPTRRMVDRKPAEDLLLHPADTPDVTERTRAALERNLLAAIVESTEDAIISKTLDGFVTSWNGAAERLFGYTAPEIVGKHISMLMPPEHSEDVAKIIECIRRGERVDHYETKRRAKDGRIIDISLTVSPLRDAEGDIVGASKVARDITQRKKDEAERERLYQELRDKDRKKDEFLAMLAHELRNPIAGISNALAVFASRKSLPEKIDWVMEVINRQTKHLARLSDDLLDVSRIASGKIELRREILEATPILESAVATVRPLFEERNHTLVVSSDRGNVWLEADPTRLEQIVVNLLTNAAKYSQDGSRVELSARTQHPDVVVTVTDSGFGIEPEMLPKIFERFVQCDRSLARSAGGIGIGLTLVKRLVEMHGGRVTAKSEGANRGSEFVVQIPAARQPTKAEQPREEAEHSPRKARILVVDDNADSAQGMATVLKLSGHEVRTAGTGAEALEIARQHAPEFVLLDIGMPVMDGYEVAARLRQQETCREAVIIAISGYGQEEHKRRSRDAGFDHHLVKPVDHKALRCLLSRD